jgi:hypothetical protein
MPTCDFFLRSLQSDLESYSRFLPLAPAEPPDITLRRDATTMGRIEAPSYPPASSLTISCLQRSVYPGRSAVFVVAPLSDGLSHCVAATLATIIAAEVMLLPMGSATKQYTEQSAHTAPVPPPPPPLGALLPVTYEPSIMHGGVLVDFPIPPSTPKGSCVVIRRASIAGCEIVLAKVPHVMVGFNNDPALPGPVLEAAQAGDAPTLKRLLEGGASTEEANPAVSRSEDPYFGDSTARTVPCHIRNARTLSSNHSSVTTACVSFPCQCNWYHPFRKFLHACSTVERLS